MSTFIIANAQVAQFSGREYVVKIPAVAVETMQTYIDQSREKHNGYLRITVDFPARPRTTGPRSQEARFRGHCEDLSQQMPGISAEEIAQAFKRMAARAAQEEGFDYPVHLSIDGYVTGDSNATLTIEQESFLLKVQQRFADGDNDGGKAFWLTEYAEVDGKLIVYKSIGGRTYQEMQRHAEYVKELL